MPVRTAHPPVVVTGAHRSGTSMVARLLGRLGLVLGADLQGDAESRFFLGLNDTLLFLNNCFWDNPGPMAYLAERPELLEDYARCVERELEGLGARRFLGRRCLWRCRPLEHVPGPWGWKDPRAVLTLPVWLRVFPEVRVVYQVRNGVDVARSLVVRERRAEEDRRRRLARRLRRRSFRGTLRESGLRGSLRCATLEGAFSLWEDYVEIAERNLSAMPADRVFRLRYEDFVGSAPAGLSRLARFCGLDGVGPEAIREACTDLRGDRAFAYRRDPELSAFFERVRETPWMQRLGYGGDGRRDAVSGGAEAAKAAEFREAGPRRDQRAP
ncbi:hypothetical protein G3N55_05435 [Dissulfurirhabdus thermomarina]|uniref:Sulfotransferase n=1 Tax=Dissulfurirhabdus thermomarina TaxID=1765737 RepID=A0A6N9TRB0_DISTH|nr:sulfotransferase [Dissulfurirhabdus thermomarina]NDY42284.1 hypothetical protein [Dissulfurirhabdus thermomarina]NMX23036.1 hypothetical protein [Dissulfurirhabdus thermomarina]